jgi:hypothetical protein
MHTTFAGHADHFFLVSAGIAADLWKNFISIFDRFSGGILEITMAVIPAATPITAITPPNPNNIGINIEAFGLAVETGSPSSGDCVRAL